ncbi:hypothetical protein LAZ67_11003166 [Cordylochernes scorpioides]|uniref:Uncharacterized protein n=1 Tax=Cordylochernes scorpioides TaxID=51811 RepID=A0ABY6L1H6_9ARAC|nr:hypothetical protein LAZ67_11003166 [Cordylochernes scorpioides]
MFSEGREDVNDEERAGRPSTSTTDEKNNEVEKMILANRRITVREVAEDLNISIGSCLSIFINDLGMRRVAAKFVPKLLNCDQKQHRMNIANEMLDSVRDDPNLLQRVITGDEAGVVPHEFLPQGRTPWYSPDLAPCDFFLFPKLKRPMKGRRYATLDEIKTTSKEELKKILKNDFLKCFEDWKNRWHKSMSIFSKATAIAGHENMWRLTPRFHRRVKAKFTLQDDDVPIDDTTTKPLFTPQEKGRKGHDNYADYIEERTDLETNEEICPTADVLCGAHLRREFDQDDQLRVKVVGPPAQRGMVNDHSPCCDHHRNLDPATTSLVELEHREVTAPHL